MAAPELIKSEKLPFPLPASKLHEIMVNFCIMEFEAKGELDAVFLIQVPGNLFWIRTKWENERDKYATAQAMHFMLHKFGALNYSFAVEAYVSAYSKEELEAADFLMPSQKQKRDEVLMITTQRRDVEEPIFSRFIINQRPNTRANYLGPRVDETHNYAGMLMNLFKTRKERLDATQATGAQI